MNNPLTTADLVGSAAGILRQVHNDNQRDLATHAGHGNHLCARIYQWLDDYDALNGQRPTETKAVSEPAHDGPEPPLPGPTAPAQGAVVELGAPRHISCHAPVGQRGTIAGAPYDGLVLVDMLVHVRRAVPVDRLRQIGGGH